MLDPDGVERVVTWVADVDIELAEDGSVEYLALGSRAAGIGPTLPPAVLPDDVAEADDEGDGDGGGSKSFAQLKEEFESGDADWEDDVSDSPGGDMRPDE